MKGREMRECGELRGMLAEVWEACNFITKGGRDMNPNFDKLNTVIIHPADLSFLLLGVFENFSQCFRT